MTGDRLHFETDPDFHAFMTDDGLDAHGDDRRYALDPSMPEAGLPVLASQGNFASAISPLRLGRFLNEDEERNARLPFVVTGGGGTHRFSVTNDWRRRESNQQAIGDIFRESKAGPWNVSLRPFRVEGDTAGWAVYLRRFRLHPEHATMPNELNDEPFPGAPPWSASCGGGLLSEPWRDYLLVDAGENATHAYVCEVVFAPTLASAKSLAVKAAWRDLAPQVPLKHPVLKQFRWLALRSWRMVAFGDAVKIGVRFADGSWDSVWRSASRL
jgi:hypothetical protein